MICNKIQALEYPSGIPAELFTAGVLFLDVFPDFSIRQTRRAEELNEVGKITVSAALAIDLPDTTKNFMVLGKYINPNVHDFDFKPLKVIAYSAGNVITHSLLYVLSHDERAGRFTCELRDDESHWVVGSKKLKLNTIEFDPYNFTQANVEASWAQNIYADGDPGIAFPLIYYGAFKETSFVSMSDMRPLYSVLHLLKRGFAKIGWIFKSPIFDLDIGKKLWAYLIEPFDVAKQQAERPNTFSAAISSEILFTTPVTGYKVIFDQEEYDDNGVYDPATGEFSAQGNYDIYFDVYFKDLFDPDAPITYRIVKQSGLSKTILFERSDTPDVLDDGGVITYRIGNAALRVNLIPSDNVYIELDLPGQGERMVSGFFNNRNNVFILAENETFLPNIYIGSEYRLYDLFRGVIHLFRGKIHTDHNLREVWLYPNYTVKWWDEEIEGYYLDSTVLLKDLQEINSSVVTSQSQEVKRYLRLQFKASTDLRIQGLNYPKDKPIFSKTVDLGENFENELEVYENPFFEPTVNDKVFSIRPLIIAPGNEYHIDLPFMVDNDQEFPSFNIAPRILIFHGLAAYKGKDGQDMAWRWMNTTQSQLPYASQLPNLLDAGSEPIEEILVYGDQLNDLYSIFWKRWVYDNLVNTKVNILAYLKPTEFFGYNFRKAYQVNSNGKDVFGRILSINDFDGCGNTATPVDLIPSTGRVTAPVKEDETTKEFCAGQNPILTVVKAGTVWTATSDTSQITDGILSTTIQWRYYDTPTWTTGNVVTDPTKPFYFRLVVELETCGTKSRFKYFDPCNNQPVILWEMVHADPSDPSKWCITAQIGGVLEDPILSSSFTKSIDNGVATPYTIGTEICGIEEKVCISGTVTFDNDCDPVPLEACYDFPPYVVNCLDNQPGVICNELGIGMFVFDKTGNWVSPLSVYFIQYRRPGEGDDDWKIWDHHAPVPVPGQVEIRGVFFWCDTCPPVCTQVVSCMEPMAMVNPELLMQSPMNYSWDWSRLPKDQIEIIKHLYAHRDGAKIALIHNRYHLSDYEYCCGSDLENVLLHVKHAIENGTI